jgi:hypothetical protein
MDIRLLRIRPLAGDGGQPAATGWWGGRDRTRRSTFDNGNRPKPGDALGDAGFDHDLHNRVDVFIGLWGFFRQSG